MPMAHHCDIPYVFACIYLHGFSFERSHESNTAEIAGSTRQGGFGLQRWLQNWACHKPRGDGGPGKPALSEAEGFGRAKLDEKSGLCESASPAQPRGWMKACRMKHKPPMLLTIALARDDIQNGRPPPNHCIRTRIYVCSTGVRCRRISLGLA